MFFHGGVFITFRVFGGGGLAMPRWRGVFDIYTRAHGYMSISISFALQLYT